MKNYNYQYFCLYCFCLLFTTKGFTVFKIETGNHRDNLFDFKKIRK